MNIKECRDRNCIHVSSNRNCRNCGVTDCSCYPDLFEERWTAEEDWEFDECENEEN